MAFSCKILALASLVANLGSVGSNAKFASSNSAANRVSSVSSLKPPAIICRGKTYGHFQIYTSVSWLPAQQVGGLVHRVCIGIQSDIIRSFRDLR